MSECVKVIVRCRPMNTKEKNLQCAKIIGIDQKLLQVSITKPKILGSELAAGKVLIEKSGGDAGEFEPKSFTFDGVYDDDSKQRDVFDETALPLLQSVMEGYNGTIFAYGQTGCGKTFTMEGVRSVPELRGIIPTTFASVFSSIDENAAPGRQFLVRASYIEIYNEEVRDLTSDNPKARCELKEDKDKGVYIKGLVAAEVRNEDELEALMNKGNSNRTVGATLMNADSSRSHSIFTITVECSEPDTAKGGDEVKIKQGKLNLVDLAGSERQSKTQAEGVRLKEATKINLSLSALGNVIEALVANASGKARHIPYRDSKLTRLLQDSLGGNTKTIMIAAISPADYNFEETLSTLRYANRAKNIKNKPKVNEDPKDALLREYQDEIKRLKLILEEKGLGDLLTSMPAMAAQLGALAKAAPKASTSKAATSEPGSARSPSPSVDSEVVAAALTGKDAQESEAASAELADDLDRMADEKQHHERLAAVLEAEIANRAQEVVAMEAEQHEIQKRIESEAAAGKDEVVALLESEKRRLESEQRLRESEAARFEASMAAEKAEHESKAAELQAEMEERLREESARRKEIEDKLTFIKEKTVKEKEALKSKLKQLQEKLINGHERIKDIRSDQEEKLREMRESELAMRRKQAELEAERRKQEEEALFLEGRYATSEAELADLKSKLGKLARRYRSLEREQLELQDALEEARANAASEAREADRDLKLYQQICVRFLTATDLDAIIKRAVWSDGRDQWTLPVIDVPVVFPTVHATHSHSSATSSSSSSSSAAAAASTVSPRAAWRRAPEALTELSAASSTVGSSGALSVLERLRLRAQENAGAFSADRRSSLHRSEGAGEWKRSVLARLSSSELQAMAVERAKRGPSAPVLTASEARATALAVSENIDAITAGVKRRDAFQSAKLQPDEEKEAPHTDIAQIDAAVKKRPAFAPARPPVISTSHPSPAPGVLPDSAYSVPSRAAFSPAPKSSTPLSPPGSGGLDFDKLPKGRPAFSPRRA